MSVEQVTDSRKDIIAVDLNAYLGYWLSFLNVNMR